MDRGLLDTSAFIALASINPAALPRECSITAITLAELAAGPLIARGETEQADRQARLQFAATSFDALPFDAAAARAFGEVSASLRRRGRKLAARTYDALIAATALANGLAVITCNPADFEGIPHLEVVGVGPQH